ncbi:hypothetical protein OS493_039242 [Desmophyllum pertusum]|uniref:Uncharacterized protein n=1 Tax=Desmophyllum pertusum TaxID=174260 RepID=A0A9X0D101_9CNID|nr:hypothetical protein OS493_039242 [Desmophyllum pertusum]
MEPAEEMETDELALPTTPSIEQVMERNQHPFTMAMPFGQLPDAWWPVATAMGRSEATATEPQQESMETNQELIDARQPVAKVHSGSWADAMRLNATEQAIMQPAVKLAMPALTTRTMSPLGGSNGRNVRSSLIHQFVNQQPHGGTECKVNNGQNFATIGQQLSVADEPGPSVYNEHPQATEHKFNEGKRFTAIELQELAIDDESGAVLQRAIASNENTNLTDGKRFTAI